MLEAKADVNAVGSIAEDGAKARGEQASAAELYRGAGDLMAVGFGEGHPYVIECRAKAPRPGSYFPPLR